MTCLNIYSKLIWIQDCDLLPGHGDVFTTALEQNRDAAEKQCQSGRETLRVQLAQTYVPQFIRIIQG